MLSPTAFRLPVPPGSGQAGGLVEALSLPSSVLNQKNKHPFSKGLRPFAATTVAAAQSDITFVTLSPTTLRLSRFHRAQDRREE